MKTALVAAMGIGATRAPVITAIQPIALHRGNNVLPDFLPGGRTATIIQSWRGNGNAHGVSGWYSPPHPGTAQPRS